MNDEVIIINNKMWPKYQVSSGTCNNETLIWYEAIEWVKNLNWLGYSDWRLPTKEELLELYDNKNLINYASSWYWSSSEYLDTSAYIVYFYNGSINGGVMDYNFKVYDNYVRAVRDTIDFDDENIFEL